MATKDMLTNANGERLRHFPRRIACLSDESTEWLYLLGEQERIAGVSGFTQRPPEARTKPRISTFRDANFDAIAELQPDLIVTYSDVQAEITREAARRGFTVLNCNQRSLAEVFETLALMARMVGREREGEALMEEFRQGLEAIANAAVRFSKRPRVFFEEWGDPIISGIEWVEELVEIAGGEPVFPELRRCGKAQDRVVSADAVAERAPDVILASWCGMKADLSAMRARRGWEAIPAIRNDRIFEIPSSLILQPGPAALTEGVRRMHEILAAVAGVSAA